MRTQSKGGLLALSIMLAPTACNDHPLKAVEMQIQQENDDTVAVSVNRDVDILFVIDNSRSMAKEQETLARNFGPLIERLEHEDVRANYRIAVTTTDFGHIHCVGNGGGNFKTTSCRRRPEDFQIVSFGEVVEDYFDEACASVCQHEEIEILPTTTFHDPTPRVRPWIENINGVTNLAEGVDAVEAFQCLGPQGVTGCGFESPLEAMRHGLLQAGDENSEEYGFMRPGAILAVVFVTDEADCSSRYANVADPWEVNGSRALWSPENRASGRLTSEVCWFAGVDCEEQADGTRECWSVNKASDGTEAEHPEEMVLHPLDRYADFLLGLEEQKQKLNPDQELLVAVLSGVPTDYDGGKIPYSMGTDQEFVLDHGIGAGCESGNGKAAPPVRLAELAQEFQTDSAKTNLFSVCKEDYSDSMSAIAEEIGRQVRPPCVRTCVADNDVEAEGLQHSCQLEEEYTTPTGETVDYSIPPCIVTNNGFEMPADTDACYRSLSDTDGLTAREDDDMSAACVEEGWNLELAIERRDGALAPAGAQVRARCSVSSVRGLDCPGLTP